MKCDQITSRHRLLFTAHSLPVQAGRFLAAGCLIGSAGLARIPGVGSISYVRSRSRTRSRWKTVENENEYEVCRPRTLRETTNYRSPTCPLLCIIATPHPYQRVCKRLLEHFSITMICGAAEHVTEVITLGFQRSGRSLIGHDPVVICLLRIFGAKVILRYMQEDAQWLLVTVFNKFHTGMVFPCTERVTGFFRRVIVLLIDERTRVSDEATKQIGTEPANG